MGPEPTWWSVLCKYAKWTAALTLRNIYRSHRTSVACTPDSLGWLTAAEAETVIMVTVVLYVIGIGVSTMIGMTLSRRVPGAGMAMRQPEPSGLLIMTDLVGVFKR